MSIELISKYRSQIMGLATLWVMTSHVRIPTNGGGKILNFIEYIGFGGVEMFMLVSGFGLYFAFQKSTSLKKYYFRRIVRIVPIWIIAAALLYFFSNPYPLLSLDFIRRVGQCWWFVPFILFVYAISPLIYYAVHSKSRIPLVVCIVGVILSQVTYKVLGISNITVTLSFARIIDFVIGMWLAKLLTKGKLLNVRAVVFWGIVGFLLVYLLNQNIIFRGFWNEHRDLRLYLMIMTGPFMCLVAIVLSLANQYLSVALKWIGQMSFEVYLVHVLIWWIIRDDNLISWYLFYSISLIASYLLHMVNKTLSRVMLQYLTNDIV